MICVLWSELRLPSYSTRMPKRSSKGFVSDRRALTVPGPATVTLPSARALARRESHELGVAARVVSGPPESKERNNTVPNMIRKRHIEVLLFPQCPLVSPTRRAVNQLFF